MVKNENTEHPEDATDGEKIAADKLNVPKPSAPRVPPVPDRQTDGEKIAADGLDN